MEIDTSSQIPVFRSLNAKKREKCQKVLMLQIVEQNVNREGKKILLLQNKVKKHYVDRLP